MNAFDTEPPSAPRSREAEDGFLLPVPIVGVGASAGGLEAVTQLLEALPAEPGLALLIVLHLQRDRESHLPELLDKITPLPVREAEQGTKVQANHVYVIPPGAVMTLEDGHLGLVSRAIRGQNMPIDHLFRSLAEVQKSKAIGVILSGDGIDGTLGFKDIKSEGGITIAQEEKSARHDSMPRSAIASGCVDYVLSPDAIGRELLRLSRHPYSTIEESGLAGVADEVNSIIALLRQRTDVDFTHYKRTTIRRRIARRMALRGLERQEDYLAVLRDEPAELTSLYQDFLIRVTQFFRDPEAFEALKEKVFPLFAQGRPPSQPIRIWVSGCSTGEEVYSLAIALLEFLDNRPDAPAIKILATDLNNDALERARVGVYVDNIEIDVSPERLRRFFVRVNSSYHISKSVRELCVFSRHNLGIDPPFSHLDLISCRNVLIYMDTALQRRVLPILHYALKPGGILFLGSSESIGLFSDLFATMDSKHRLFGKKSVSGALTLEFGPYVAPEGVQRPGREEGAPIWNALDVQREADRIVLARYAPVGVVIDEAMGVLQFRGRTGIYLEPAPGMASLDLLRMLREGLLAEVRAAIAQAKSENSPAVKEGLRLVDNNQTCPVRIEVIPFKVPPSGLRFFLVLFQDLPVEGQPAPVEREVVRPEQPGGQIQQELGALREYLQSVIEEQESTNEELKSANEEILSANEELQSTNEELQTAKEEAQSANEELGTVNEELRYRNAELARVNNDLMNLLSGVNIPIVMVNRDLRIRQFTPLAEKTFNLIPTDMGRPISDIKPNLRIDDLGRLITSVIDKLTPHESEIQDLGGRWYSLRIRPYVTMDSKIDGASVVLLDIDTIKQALEQFRGGSGVSRSQESGVRGQGSEEESGRGTGKGTGTEKNTS
jgi:two-component system CheB/CheR fusion protein